MDQPTRAPRMPVFLTVWCGQLVSLIGSGLTGFGLGVWVLQRTGSVTLFALIALATTLPGIALSSLAGALVDRWDRRRVMLYSNVIAGLNTLMIALLLLGAGLKSRPYLPCHNDQLDLQYVPVAGLHRHGDPVGATAAARSCQRSAPAQPGSRTDLRASVSWLPGHMAPYSWGVVARCGDLPVRPHHAVDGPVPQTLRAPLEAWSASVRLCKKPPMAGAISSCGPACLGNCCFSWSSTSSWVQSRCWLHRWS